MGDSRRRCSPEFKRDAVALVRSSGRTIADVAHELGCGESSSGYWMAKDCAVRVAADSAAVRGRAGRVGGDRASAPPGGGSGG